MSKKMIEKLTHAQERQFAEYRDKWLAIGLSTEPTDRASVIAYGKRLMEFMKRKHLATVVMPSPMSAWLAVWILSTDPKKVESQVRSQVRSQVWSQVESQVRSQVRSQVESQVWSQVRSQVRSQVESQVWSQVESQVRSQVWSQVESQVGNLLWPYMTRYGWSAWCGYIDYCEAILKCELLDWSLIRDACTQGFCVYPLDRFVVCSEPPTRLKMRDGRLHSEDGPSVAFGDGVSVYSIDGVQVNEQIVMRPETQTVAEIDGEGNAEVKRIRIERFGWTHYLTRKNAKVLEHRHNSIEGTDEALMRCDNMAVLVCACPSTGRVYAMETDPNVTTCIEAQNYLSSNKAARMVGAS